MTSLTKIRYTLKTLRTLPRTPGKIFYKPKVVPWPGGKPGEGLTTYWGDSFYSTLGTRDVVAGARNHEIIHRFFTPMLQIFREVRVVLAENSKLQSYLLRYMEEMICESGGQPLSRNLHKILEGITFSQNMRLT